ncbi:histidine phosphatase family protein [Halomicroarcula sp. GCM10025324]|uniref:histidine phosphatase family protein n=1 Tax=Haloarcula TaxID=2237 RepID=UPI0023E77D09|nr:histidine phosphatase family protein [Halomicroarcula sp. ZS-22-S1]
MSRILLTRHGETPWNREGRIQGWAATGLTERGRREASAMGAWVDDTYDVDRILASDSERTRRTTANLRDAAGPLPEPAFDATLRERGFGVYQGFLVEDLFERYPEHDPSHSVSALPADPDHGESVAAFCERVTSAWDSVRAATDPGETTLVVTHGGVIKVLLAELTDRDRDAALAAHSHDNCAVTEIRLDGADSTLVAEEQTDWRETVDW